MPQLDPTTFAPQLIWLAITFVVLYILMSTVGLPRVGKVIDERRGRIEGDLGTAERVRSESEAVRAAYEQALAEARQSAHASIQETLNRLNAAASQRQHEASSRLADELKAAEARIASAKDAGMAQLRDVAVAVAGEAAGRLLGFAPDATVVANAVSAKLGETA